MRLGELRIQFDCFQGGGASRRFDLAEVFRPPYAPLYPRVRQPCHKRQHNPEKLNGALEVLNGLTQIILIALDM